MVCVCVGRCTYLCMYRGEKKMLVWCPLLNSLRHDLSLLAKLQQAPLILLSLSFLCGHMQPFAKSANV